MLHITKNKFSLLKRSAVIGFAVAGLFCACLPISAQNRAGGERHTHGMDRIDLEEGARRLAAFRNQRLEGDYCFQFMLEQKPRRGRTVRYKGMMWGSWNEQGPVTRLRVFPNQDSKDADSVNVEPVELIIQNGPVQKAWIRRAAGSSFELLEGTALFEPILPGLLYSAFDLQMPFVYWDKFTYEGPILIGASRVAQQFLMEPPVGSASAVRGIAGVRVGLDDTYGALWRVEVVDAKGEDISRFSVESFKKVQEQYIVKRITLKDFSTKDRTTFEVKAAAVGLSLNRNLFNSCAALSLDDYVPAVMQNL